MPRSSTLVTTALAFAVASCEAQFLAPSSLSFSVSGRFSSEDVGVGGAEILHDGPGEIIEERLGSTDPSSTEPQQRPLVASGWRATATRGAVPCHQGVPSVASIGGGTLSLAGDGGVPAVGTGDLRLTDGGLWTADPGGATRPSSKRAEKDKGGTSTEAIAAGFAFCGTVLLVTANLVCSRCLFKRRLGVNLPHVHTSMLSENFLSLSGGTTPIGSPEYPSFALEVDPSEVYVFRLYIREAEISERRAAKAYAHRVVFRALV